MSLAHDKHCVSDAPAHEVPHNARLIVTAPKLLSALKRLVEVKDEALVMEHDLDGHDADGCAPCVARAAIREVEGE